MKKVKMNIELKIPETYEECKSLWGPSDRCCRCAYSLLDNMNVPCMHQRILEVMDKGEK